MSFSTLDKEGIYDKTQRWRFTNIDNEEYIGRWNGHVFVTVPPGGSVTLPESQAINFAKDLCTRVMQKEERERFVPNMRESTWEESQRTRVGSPIARKPYEEKILQKIEAGEETPEIEAMRSAMREELLADMSAQRSAEPPTGPKGLADFAVVRDARKTDREGKEFEGVTALK